MLAHKTSLKTSIPYDPYTVWMLETIRLMAKAAGHLKKYHRDNNDAKLDDFLKVVNQLDDHIPTLAYTPPKEGESLVVYPVFGLINELGEFLEKLETSTGEDELVDVQWYNAEIATTLDIPLGRLYRRSVEKLFDRMERGVITGDGDNR